MDLSLSIITLLLPLFMFLLLGLCGMKMSKQAAGVLGTLGMLVTTVVAYGVALNYFFNPEFVVDGVREAQSVFDATWLTLGDGLKVTMGIYIDPISAMMLIVISTISMMVHLYSLGYMHGEKGFQRYYAFLALFTFSMLGLVVATNIFQMFIFFEMVGVSSYLLIGFYYEKGAAVAASKKAFIVTRFADLGFLIGIMLLSYYCGTFDFKTLMASPGSILANSAGVTFLGCSAASWALALIFIGGAGKSAMFPLHIWLPDAMEGPTPVSALIHAATMVVAGVFLVARMFPLYLGTPEVLELITVTGAVTALYAAIVACAQTDIKRVLAFSTISQIAFMFTALGVARPEFHEGVGYMASMFHLFTHAMFKGLLFLCAGAIIHMVHSNEMDAMGNLRKYMPSCRLCQQPVLGCLDVGSCRIDGFLYVPFVLPDFLVEQAGLFPPHASRLRMDDERAADHSRGDFLCGRIYSVRAFRYLQRHGIFHPYRMERGSSEHCNCGGRNCNSNGALSKRKPDAGSHRFFHERLAQSGISAFLYRRDLSIRHASDYLRHYLPWHRMVRPCDRRRNDEHVGKRYQQCFVCNTQVPIRFDTDVCMGVFDRSVASGSRDVPVFNLVMDE